MIPKIIHHIWVGNNLYPKEFIYFREKWKTIYSEYNFILWDNNLVIDSKIITPDIQKYYFGDYNIALKTDLLRFKILEKFGGIYVDVDTEPLKKMPDEILSYNFFSGYQPNNEIAIGIMGSEPNEKLVNDYNTNVIKNIINHTFDGKVDSGIWRVTGPEYFTKLIQPYVNNINYKFFETKYFYPYSWLEMHRRYENFKESSPESYSVHHWFKSW